MNDQVPFDPWAMALNPATGPEQLQQLAAYYPQVRPAIAVHPQAYPELLNWLAHEHDPAVLQALATRSDFVIPAEVQGGGVGTPAMQQPTVVAPVDAQPLIGQPGAEMPSVTGGVERVSVLGGGFQSQSYSAADTTNTVVGSAPQALPSYAPGAYPTTASTGIPVYGGEPEPKRGHRMLISILAVLIVILLILVISVIGFVQKWNMWPFNAFGAEQTDDIEIIESEASTSTKPTPSKTPEPTLSEQETESVQPPPSDSIEAKEFKTISGNTICHLEGDGVNCALITTDTQDNQCYSSSDSTSVNMNDQGQVEVSCGTYPYSADGSEAWLPVFPYNSKMHYGNISCETRESGTFCYTRKTGHGFLLSRSLPVMELSYQDYLAKIVNGAH